MGIGAGWYYDSLDGMVVHQNLAESIPNAAFSYYHGPYATEALAIAHKGVAGAPGQTSEPITQQVGNAAGTVTGTAGVTDFLSRLSSANTWERVAMVALGMLLIAIGVAHITHAVPIATKVAKTAGTAAVLA
jgi:hypothetical protein